MGKDFDLEARLVDFAARIIKVADALPNTGIGGHLSGQIGRSGTAPALNYGEAQAAESRSDFIRKMKVCLKELKETRVCLLIICRAELIQPVDSLGSLIVEVEELIAIFAKSINTAKANMEKARAN